jgi:hypothetical protein
LNDLRLICNNFDLYAERRLLKEEKWQNAFLICKEDMIKAIEQKYEGEEDTNKKKTIKYINIIANYIDH